MHVLTRTQDLLCRSQTFCHHAILFEKAVHDPNSQLAVEIVYLIRCYIPCWLAHDAFRPSNYCLVSDGNNFSWRFFLHVLQVCFGFSWLCFVSVFRLFVCSLCCFDVSYLSSSIFNLRIKFSGRNPPWDHGSKMGNTFRGGATSSF